MLLNHLLFYFSFCRMWVLGQWISGCVYKQVTDLWRAKIRIGPLRFQAGCRKRRLNLALVFCVLFCVIVFLFSDAWSFMFCSVVTVAEIWSLVGGGVFVNMPLRCRWRWSVSKPGLIMHKAVIADVDVVKNSSVVTITELSPRPRWFATTQPYSVLAALFLENCPLLPPSCESSKCRVIWSRVNARRHRPPPPRASASPLARFGQRDPQCRLRWLVLRHDHSARPDSTQHAMITALNYSGVAARYLVP